MNSPHPAAAASPAPQSPKLIASNTGRALAYRVIRPSLRIAVLHCGPVGLGSAVLLARQHRVVLWDADPQRVHTVNAGCSPLEEPDLTPLLQCEGLRLRATTCLEDATEGADYVVVTTPTRFERSFGSVDTRALDECLEAVQRLNPDAVVVLASNLPVGYAKRWGMSTMVEAPIVAPVVLRPGQALQDLLHPERLVVGERSMRAAKFAWLWRECLQMPSLPVVFTQPTEAEAIYLFWQKRLLQGGELSYSEVARYANRHGLDLGQLLEGLDLDGLPELVAQPPARHSEWLHLGSSVEAA